MQSDPLQQLRDVHLPAEPGAWPPALGWWLLAALSIAFLVWSGLRLWRYYQQRRPIRLARKHLIALQQAFANGELTDLDYAHACNKILKRLFVRGLGQSQYAAMNGDRWLASLDAISQTDFFANGHGQVLGDLRFQAPQTAAATQLEIDRLHTGLLQLLRRITPGTLS